MTGWDLSTDFVVVGSGAGGMTAAITAHQLGMQTLVLEKSAVYGGTSALSGGVIWVPNNHHMPAANVPDSEEEAWVYLKKLIGDDVADERIRAYIRRAPEMLRFMEQHSLVRFDAADEYADYYPELPGGKPGARSLDPLPYSRRKLGELETTMRAPTHGQVLDRFMLTAKEAHLFLNFTWRTYLLLFWQLFRFFVLDISFRLRKRPDNRLTLGMALCSRLRKSLQLRDVDVWLNTPVLELVVESGRVTGVIARRGERHVRIEARKGVLLASGGFAHNEKMRQQYQQHPIGADWTVASPDDTGDGILMGQRVGAQLALMHCAWWTPALKLPDGRAEALIVGKSMPGCIMVNQNGERFTNDAAPYEDLVKGQYRAHSEACSSIPCYLVFDGRFRHNYPVGLTLGPGKAMPDAMLPREFLASGWLKKAESIEELARQLKVDGVRLRATIERHNEFARSGKDLDFGRGDSLTDRYYSDHSVTPNSCMAPITQPPFYALEIWPGDLGTKGGLLCDEESRVLSHSGTAIEGLYATGNCSAAVMGDTYPGAGATLGPAMTFGYIAACHAAKAAARS